MKKGLLLLLLSFTFLLTGCETKKDEMQALLDNYVLLLNTVVTGEEVDIEGLCYSVFVESDAIECTDEFESIPDDELPYYFEMTMELIDYADYEDDHLTQYNTAYRAYILITTNIQLYETDDLETNTEEAQVLIVEVDGELRLYVSYNMVTE